MNKPHAKSISDFGNKGRKTCSTVLIFIASWALLVGSCKQGKISTIYVEKRPHAAESKYLKTNETVLVSKDGPEETENAPINLCVDGPNRRPGQVEKIYNGTALPQHVPMTLPQTWAVGTFNGCSGILIKPRWVLSASHCNAFWDGGEFCMGKSPSKPNKCIAIKKGIDHPSLDISVVELEKDARKVLPGVEPVPILSEFLDQDWVGVTAEAAGYGAQEDGTSGVREFSAEPIVWLGNDTVTIDGKGKQGACFGDSGGPLLVAASDGSVRVAGALSTGEESCMGEDHFTRVDEVRVWLENLVGTTPPNNAKICGGTDNTGRCDPTFRQALYCNDQGRMQVDNCKDDEICSWKTEQSGWRCVKKSEDPCKGMGTSGTCQGNSLKWCGLGGLLERDCGACGEQCVEDESSGAFCLPNTCGETTFKGICKGSIFQWCDGSGDIKEIDCAIEGKGCGLTGDEGTYGCIDSGCGSLESTGQCKDNISVWCDDDGDIQVRDCANEGLVCSWVNEEIGHDCVPKPCGGLGFFGQCSGNIAQWCNQDGILEEVDCTQHAQTCGLVDDQQGYHCLPQGCGDVDFLGGCAGSVATWCNREGALESVDCAHHGQNCGYLNPETGYHCLD